MQSQVVYTEVPVCFHMAAFLVNDYFFTREWLRETRDITRQVIIFAPLFTLHTCILRRSGAKFWAAGGELGEAPGRPQNLAPEPSIYMCVYVFNLFNQRTFLHFNSDFYLSFFQIVGK